MPNSAQRFAKMEASSEFKALSPQRQAEERSALREKITGEYEALKDQTRAVAGKQRESMDQAIGPNMSGALHSVVAGLLAAGNQSSLGYLPKIASMVPGGPAEDQARASLDVASEQHPIASGIGSVAGNFLGPASAIANTGGKLVNVVGGLATKAGAGKLLTGALESEFGRRFAVATLKNLVGGFGSIAATEAVRSRDDDATLAMRLHDAAAMATSPTALGLSVIVGGAQAKYGLPPSATLAKDIAKYERITGKRVPIEVLTDSASQKKWYDSVAKNPGMRDVVKRQKDEAVAGLRAVVDDIADRVGGGGRSTESTRAGAADSVRRLVGTPAVRGAITKERTSIEKRTTAMIGGQTKVKDTFRDVLAAGMRAMRNTRSDAEPSGLEGVFRKIEAVTGGRERVPKPIAGLIPGGSGRVVQSGAKIGFTPMTLDDAEALRKATARLAWPSPEDVLSQRWGDRTRWEAARFYKVLSTAMERSFPEYQEALRKGSVLRDMERSLKEVKVSDLDDATATAFFTGKDVLKRLNVLSEKSTAQDIGSLKGWYFSKFIETLEKKDGYINPDSLNKLVRQPKSIFNSQIMEKFIPGALAEVRDHARLTAAMLGKGAGRFGPEGSETAGRMSVTRLFQDPSGVLMSALSPFGVKFVLRSAMGGKIEDAMHKLSRSGPTPTTRSAVALQQAVPQQLAPLNQSVLGIQRSSQ